MAIGRAGLALIMMLGLSGCYAHGYHYGPGPVLGGAAVGAAAGAVGGAIVGAPGVGAAVGAAAGAITGAAGAANRNAYAHGGYHYAPPRRYYHRPYRSRRYRPHPYYYGY